jgi:hypothetical protein
MRYVLDKNVLTSGLIENIKNRHDLCLTNEVISEAGFDKKEVDKIRKRGILILGESKLYFEKLREIMERHGDNLNLINLYTGKGSADVTILAHVLVQVGNSNQLFAEEFSIVTKDDELTKVAKLYEIPCLTDLP